MFEPAGVVEKICIFWEVVDLLLSRGFSVVCCFRFLSVPTCDFGGFVGPFAMVVRFLFFLCFFCCLVSEYLVENRRTKRIAVRSNEGTVR